MIIKWTLENANVKSDPLRTPSGAQKLEILPPPSDVLGMPSRSNGQRVRRRGKFSSQSSEAVRGRQIPSPHYFRSGVIVIFKRLPLQMFSEVLVKTDNVPG